MALKLTHVSKSFAAVRAVVDVSFEVKDAEITVIEGPNGSGKSTLLAMIGTLMTPTSGEIDYGALGSDVTAVRAHLGWLGHDTACYPDLTGRENVELAARLASVNVTQAWTESVERFGIGDFANRPMRSASRGQRQRIAIARAVVHRPKLLLLDEPSTGLDAIGTDRLVAMLEAEVARETAVLVVTHDTKLVQRLKATSFQMDRGRLI
jgi:heme exporter protein A